MKLKFKYLVSNICKFTEAAIKEREAISTDILFSSFYFVLYDNVDWKGKPKRSFDSFLMKNNDEYLSRNIEEYLRVQDR